MSRRTHGAQGMGHQGHLHEEKGIAAATVAAAAAAAASEGFGWQRKQQKSWEM